MSDNQSMVLLKGRIPKVMFEDYGDDHGGGFCKIKQQKKHRCNPNIGVILTPPPEDKHLCLVYMDVSQDPITSNNQTRKQFWSKVMQEYNSKKPDYIIEERNHRYVEDRMRMILKAVKNLRNCIRQVENRNQSGSSAKDIMDQAKRLMMEDKEFKKGFKFEHVWPILKDMEVFVEHDGDRASHLETPNSSSPALSSFSINLSDDSTGATTSKRPGGVKKAKTNAAHDEQMKAYAETLVKKTTVLADQVLRRQDYKIMMTDLNSITDPVSRAYILGEREKIMQRSDEQSNQDNTAGEFGQFFQNLNPSGDDLPHY